VTDTAAAAWGEDADLVRVDAVLPETMRVLVLLGRASHGAPLQKAADGIVLRDGNGMDVVKGE